MIHLSDDLAMTPVPLADGFGLLHHGRRRSGMGLVLCSPWGIHELSSRKLYFRLATRLAAAGIPTIRFDYPGTADAVDLVPDGLDSWIATAGHAADRLKATCDVERLVFAGFGLGAAIALLAADRRADAAGLVLAGPVSSGRRYLREIALGAAMVEEGLGLEPSQRPPGVSIGGIVMPAAVAADLKTLDLSAAEPGARRKALVLARPSRPEDSALADHLEGFGWPVTRALFEDFDAAMDNPTTAVLPEQAMQAILGWCGELARETTEATVAVSAVAAEPVVVARGAMRQEPVTFGRGLFGVLSHPLVRAPSPVVVFLNSGYDHHAGWAYQSARAAHALAASGVASLRFDLANVGDSAMRTGAREQVLYGEDQQADIAAALDMLAGRGETSILLVGRCSGAYAAFHATARNDRIAGAVLINPLRIIWDVDEDVDTAICTGPRSMADYRQRAMSGRTFRRLLIGDIDIWSAAKGVGTQLARRMLQHAAPIMGKFAKTNRLRSACYAQMEAIAARGARISFLCSRRDASLELLAFYFRRGFERLARFPGASFTMVENADHNVTPQAAHDFVVSQISAMALELGTPAASRSTGRDRARSPVLEPRRSARA